MLVILALGRERQVDLGIPLSSLFCQIGGLQGSVRDSVSRITVEGDRRIHLMLISGLHTHASVPAHKCNHTHTWIGTQTQTYTTHTHAHNHRERVFDAMNFRLTKQACPFWICSLAWVAYIITGESNFPKEISLNILFLDSKSLLNYFPQDSKK